MPRSYHIIVQSWLHTADLFSPKSPTASAETYLPASISSPPLSPQLRDSSPISTQLFVFFNLPNRSLVPQLRWFNALLSLAPRPQNTNILGGVSGFIYNVRWLTVVQIGLYMGQGTTFAPNSSVVRVTLGRVERGEGCVEDDGAGLLVVGCFGGFWLVAGDPRNGMRVGE